MARTPMVTRTMKTTKATILCLDLTDKQPVYKEIVLPRTYKDERSLMKIVKGLYENEHFKCVNCESFEVAETLYGMTEQEFITHAKVLEKR